MGDTAQFMATANNPIGWPGILFNSRDRPERFRWRSSDTTLARVSASGLVHALAPGLVHISSNADTASGMVAVTVIEPIDLQVRPREARIRIGDTIRISALAHDRAGNSVPGLRIFDYSVDYDVLESRGNLSFVGIDTGIARVKICAAHREALATVTVKARD